MSAIRSVGLVSPLTPALVAELEGLERAQRAEVQPELAPELLRLGATLPEMAARSAAVVGAPTRDMLLEVSRIASHLGGVARALVELPEPEARVWNERVARAQTLADCAGALADLRAGVVAALRTARAA